jgi:hypothetical protein
MGVYTLVEGEAVFEHSVYAPVKAQAEEALGLYCLFSCSLPRLHLHPQIAARSSSPFRQIIFL